MRLFTLLRIVAIATGAMLVFGAGGIGAATGDTEVLRLPVTRFEDNPCIAGETVVLEGTMRVVSHTTTNDGGEHTILDTYFTGFHGVGLLTGSEYVSDDEQTGSSFVSSDGQPQEFTAERTFLLNRVGEDGTKLDDYLEHFVAHMTINANGVVTVDRIDSDERCR